MSALADALLALCDDLSTGTGERAVWPTEIRALVDAHAEPPVWLTVAEVAATVRMSKMSVYRLIDTGAIPHTRFGHARRIRTADLDAYIEANTRTGRA